MSLYMLDGQEVVPAPDPRTWGEWFDDADRVIFSSETYGPSSFERLVTFFIGVEITDVLGGPFYFSTGLYRGPTADDLEQVGGYRLSVSWDEAKAAHELIVAELREFRASGTY